jgi:hypothetical protein
MAKGKKDYSRNYTPGAEMPTRKPDESDASIKRRRTAWANAGDDDAGAARNAIGVSNDYKVKKTDYKGEGPKGRLGRRREFEQGPRYFSGAATEIFGSMGPTQLMEVQYALKRLGLLKDVTGVFNNATRTGVMQMLGNANAEGVGWKKWLTNQIGFLDEAGIDSLGDLSGGSERAPLSIEHSNPDEIRASVTAQSTNLLGGNYAGNPEEYVNEIHAAETAQQTAQYNQTGEGGSGGSTVAPPSVEALIMKKKPMDYQVERLGSNAQQIIGLLQRTQPGGGS